MHLGGFDKGSLKELWLSTHMMNMRLLGKYSYIQKMYKACQTCPFYDDNIERAKDLVRPRRRARSLKPPRTSYEN